MPQIDKVNLELSVVLGAAAMPIHQLLRMGRGAVIALGANEDSAVTLLANDHPIARGTVFVNGDRIGVEITDMLPRDQKGRTERLQDEGAPDREAVDAA
ncbi:FliM/FliN family flagellar motor switch protein [Hansschlegelia zhihuaiae]|uniref:Flagellar motor switch protein FliN n=1 Tax=Hansschlegelia zhihuaiae TaxID=405005 RepID=A0A4Q0MPG5_9HYPH|nr:FliM/FliN family flagellar motor switch protein [Hansschlegelia zhihuaiae]RXF74946.1 flagellar motor switch protein FliN [Hansschlegelia zhihuaiae]